MGAALVFLLLAADAGPSQARDAGAADAGSVPEPKPLLMIAASNDPVSAFSSAKPADRARVPGVTTTVQIGRTWSFAFFADGYTLPASRVVDLSVDVVIVDSTGRQVVEQASVSRAKTMDPKTMVAVPLAPPLRLAFGLTDPEGVWKVRMTLFDGVRGTSTRAETTFTVKR